MKKSEILKIYKDKLKELKKHNFLYFNKDNPKSQMLNMIN